MPRLERSPLIDKLTEDAAFAISNTRNCHGLYGASLLERRPTEAALTEQMRKFKPLDVNEGEERNGWAGPGRGPRARGVST